MEKFYKMIDRRGFDQRNGALQHLSYH